MKKTTSLFWTIIAVFMLSVVFMKSFASNNLKNTPEKLVIDKSPIKSVSSRNLHFTMELPSTMDKTKNLDEGVPFQYMDATNELYIIANREESENAKSALQDISEYDNKITLMENYLNYTMTLMKETGNKITVVDQFTAIKSKNLTGLIIQVDGKLPTIEYPISYWIASYEYDGNIYKFIFWTLQEQKKETQKIASDIFESIHFN